MTMNEKEFNDQLKELIRVVADLPIKEQKQLKSLIKQTQDQYRIKVDQITKSVTDLRICIKYLIFDLEATRRKRDQFKKMLEQPPDNPNKERMD